jgi:hypothetical protein
MAEVCSAGKIHKAHDRATCYRDRVVEVVVVVETRCIPFRRGA